MSEREERGANPFAPSRDVLAAVHDRARAVAAAERVGADDQLRAVAAAAAAPAPAQASDRAEHRMVEVRPQVVPHVTDARIRIDPEAIGGVLPSGNPHDDTFPPRRASADASAGGVAMSTAPGLGGPPPAGPQKEGTPPGVAVLAGARVGSDADAADGNAPPNSVDDAMREAELKVAEAQNREIYEREKRRRVVDEQTRGQLKRAVPGSKEHFDALALRQKWTLPLDDDDYKLWMQHQMLAQHAGALAAEQSHRRIAKAKAVARGPALALTLVVVVGALVGVGWWLGRAKDGGASAPATAAATAEAAAAPATMAAPIPTATPTAAPAEAPTAAATTTTVAPPSEGPAAPRATSGALTPPAPPTTNAAPTSPAPTGGAPAGGGKKDPWEREF